MRLVEKGAAARSLESVQPSMRANAKNPPLCGHPRQALAARQGIRRLTAALDEIAVELPRILPVLADCGFGHNLRNRRRADDHRILHLRGLLAYGASASMKPTRQPIIANDFENVPMTITFRRQPSNDAALQCVPS